MFTMIFSRLDVLNHPRIMQGRYETPWVHNNVYENSYIGLRVLEVRISGDFSVAGLMGAAIKAIAICSLYLLRDDNVGEGRKEDFLKSRVCQLIVCTTKDYQRRPTGPLTFGHVLFSSGKTSNRQQTTVRRVSGGTIQYRIETIIKRA